VSRSFYRPVIAFSALVARYIQTRCEREPEAKRCSIYPIIDSAYNEEDRTRQPRSMRLLRYLEIRISRLS
jgi:hypothetical protein